MTPLGHPVALPATGSEASDRPRRPGLIAGGETRAVLADTGSDADAHRAAIRRRGAEPCLPPRTNRTAPSHYDRHPDNERTVAERFFARVKPYRRVATRYDEKAANCPGFVRVAAIEIMLA